ncbi:hypothetical protein LCGC14_0357950 [marine sediment metagenome]|uniref:Uncharacterized protein n=1 Tax=marine sediment metagenome TaxID=412755 RepID=A0A0F9TEK2_9ZZZZ
MIRAKNKHGVMATGNLFRTRDGKYYLMSPSVTLEVLAHNPEMAFVEIDLATGAEDTGKDDLHGDRIYGSRGEMKGRDRVIDNGGYEHGVWWDTVRLVWMMGNIPLGPQLESELEIVKAPDSD